MGCHYMGRFPVGSSRDAGPLNMVAKTVSIASAMLRGIMVYFPNDCVSNFKAISISLILCQVYNLQQQSTVICYR